LIIDLRSDTVTKPTEEMRKAMYEAEVGDDVYGEDPTVTKLEDLAAEMLGMEKALFVTSGTQGNQIAVLTHTHPGEEIILEQESHIFYYEAGAVAALAGVQTRTIPGINGEMPINKVKEAIRGTDIHLPRTSLITLENTHNRAGGTILSLEYMQNLAKLANNFQVPIHLDGARLFNAAVALNIPAKEITKYVDTVQVCLSKGLSAPIGSILAGSKEFVELARKWRKRLGGGMRQAGIIAAAGILSLTKMVERLKEDHENARILAEGLANINPLIIDLHKVQTNIVLIDVSKTGKLATEWVQILKENGILTGAFSDQLIRLVTHREISKKDIDLTLHIFAEVVKK